MAKRAKNVGGGLYCIVNKELGKVYIGRSSNITRRLKIHVMNLRRGTHHNGPLQRDWLALGESAFEASVLRFESDESKRFQMENQAIKAQPAAMLYNAQYPPAIKQKSTVKTSRWLASTQQPHAILHDFYSVEQLAELKQVSLKTVYSWVSKGIAPAFEKASGMYWFHKPAADQFQPPKRGRKRL